VTVHHDKFLIIKPTRCTDFSNLFLEWNSACFGQLLCPSSGVLHCTHSNGTSWSCLQAVSKLVWRIPLLCVQRRTPDDGQSNCPKHAEFHSNNKFEKLVHLVGFIIRKVHIPFLVNYFTNHTPYIKSVYEKHVHFCPQNCWSVKYLARNKVKLHTDRSSVFTTVMWY